MRNGLKEVMLVYPPVSWFRLFLSFGGWVAILLAGLAVYFAYIAMPDSRLASKFEREGVIVVARGVDYRRATRPNGRAVYVPTYEYTFNGEVYQAESQSPLTTSGPSRTPEHVEIRILPSGPTIIEQPPGHVANQSIGPKFWMLLTGSLALTVFWFSGSVAARGVLARRIGQSFVAKVRSNELEVVFINNHVQTLRWDLPDGREGFVSQSFFIRAFDVQVGQDIVVFDYKGRTWWEGHVGSRTEHVSDMPKNDDV